MDEVMRLSWHPISYWISRGTELIIRVSNMGTDLLDPTLERVMGAGALDGDG